MNAQLSEEIAQVLQNREAASKMMTEIIKARNSNSGVTVKVGNQATRTYRPAGSTNPKR